jgi:hypothetical protein
MGTEAIVPDEYLPVCSMDGAPCDIDIDECISSPCTNGSPCSDSLTDAGVPSGHYHCACRDGFANGMCDYEGITGGYDALCQVDSGTCDIDVDECASAPCANGGTCTESSVDASVNMGQFRCTCVYGFSSPAGAVEGQCQVDFDECASEPCQNAAAWVRTHLRACAVPVSPTVRATTTWTRRTCSTTRNSAWVSRSTQLRQ